MNFFVWDFGVVVVVVFGGVVGFVFGGFFLKQQFSLPLKNLQVRLLIGKVI